MVISVGAKPIFDKVLIALLIKVQKSSDFYSQHTNNENMRTLPSKLALEAFYLHFCSV